MRLTGSQIIMETLLEQGVDTVFGYPGGAALNIYNEFYNYRDKIRHVMTAHEQGAAHAADGYSRTSKKTGVVIATSGPGATNLVTGIATAFMDSVPMVAITANVPDSLIGRDSFQEICITGVTMPITKHNFFVNRIEDLAAVMREAFRIANDGRKGPVLVDVTKDVTGNYYEYTKEEKKIEEKEPIKIKNDEVLAEVVELINNAKRPVIFYGGGVRAADAREELVELMDKANIPCTHTIMAAGVNDYDDPRNMGLIGMHGTIAANNAMDKADVVIALGTRFSDRVALNREKFAANAIKIQVDIDISEINKNVIVDYSIIGDVKDFLQVIIPQIRENNRDEWIEEVTSLRKMSDASLKDNGYMHPKELITSICENTDKDTIYVTDVGQHQMWAAQYLKDRKTKGFVTSGGLGTMGFGYGAAIGVQVANPNMRVVHFTGDGSFHMNLNEACTAVSENLPIITVILNNTVLGMVYQWQTIFYDKKYSGTKPGRKTDFVKVGEGFGVKGYKANTIEELNSAFADALKQEGPVWIECAIDPNERVLPMIPGGGTVEDMIIG